MHHSDLETITAKQLRTILQISRSTYYRMLNRGELPRPINVTSKIRIFRKCDVLKILNHNQSQN